MATPSGVKARELREIERSNKAKEAIASREADIKAGQLGLAVKKEKNEEFHRGMKDYFTGLSGGAKSLNDFGWYTQYKTTTLNALKQPIHDVAGASKVWDPERNIYPDNSDTEYQAYIYKPAVVKYNFIPTIGSSADNTTGISLAMRDFNTRVRGSNAGATNYDAADLIMYPLATDSIIYMLSWLRRGLALVRYQEQANKSTESYELLLAHCAYNANLADTFQVYRNSLIDIYNETVDRLNKMRVPSEMPYIKRHAWLSNVLFGCDSGVGISYKIVNPEGYFVYDETNSRLVFYSLWNTGTTGILRPLVDTTILAIRYMFNRMISPLIHSSAINTMAGDIDKAKIRYIQLPTMEYTDVMKLKVAVETDVKYLQSFKNAQLCQISDLTQVNIQQGVTPSNDPFIYQGTYSGGVWSGIEIAYVEYGATTVNSSELNDEAGLYASDRYIDYYDGTKVTEEDQCYNLSFQITTEVSKSAAGFHMLSCRSEVLVDEVTSYSFEDSASWNHIGRNSLVLDQTSLMTEIDSLSSSVNIGDELKNLLERITLYANIPFHPACYINIPTFDVNAVMKNYSMEIWPRNVNRNKVDKDVVEKVQKYTLQSMFMIP